MEATLAPQVYHPVPLVCRAELDLAAATHTVRRLPGTALMAAFARHASATPFYP